MHKKAGDYGETVVRGYLESKGYGIIATNYKRAGGEIDIIAREGEYLVFVEVKYRRQTEFDGLSAVDARKRRRIIAAAYAYLAEKGLTDCPCRFDVAEVFGRELLEVNYIENAFGE